MKSGASISSIVSRSPPACAARKRRTRTLFFVPVHPNLASPSRPSFATADFNQTLNTTRNIPSPSIRLTNVDTGVDVTGRSSYGSPDSILLVFPIAEAAGGLPTSECGTTYEVTVGGKGPLALKSVNGARLSGAPLGVTLERGTASWTFTTVGCT